MMNIGQNAHEKHGRGALLGCMLAAGFALLCVATPEAHAEGRKIVVEGFEASRSTMSLQLGFGGMSLSDDTLDVDGVARLGGMNLGFRWNPFDWGGLEVSVGGYGRTSEDGLVYEDRGLFTLSWLWYFARHYKHRFYGITGLASSSVNLSFDNEVFQSYSEGGIVLGIGSEWLISKSWMVTADLRMLALGNDQGEEWAADVESSEGGDGSQMDGVYTEWLNTPESRIGMMMNFGVGYRW